MPANAVEFQGTTFEVSSGSGGAKTISGVTLGAITEITATAHGLAVGDVVTLASIGGTTGLNGLTPMIIAKEANSFFINVDSSGMSAYTSGGTATPVTWTTIGEVSGFDGLGGGSAAVIDKTTSASTRKEKMMGLPDEGQVTLSLNEYPSDAGQAVLKTARANRTEKNFRIVFSDATLVTFAGYVLSFGRGGAVDDKLAGSVTVEITGEVTEA